MYSDHRPCEVCGAKVRLEPADRPHGGDHQPDETVDRRVCTNADCETNHGSDRSP